MRRILYVLVFLLAFTSIAFSESNLTNNYIELKKGDFGDDVSALQKKLTELEYLIGDEPGHFGTSTKNALFMYQNDHNLIPTGILDEETYELLFPTQYRTTENVGSNFHEDAYPGEIITAKSFLWLLGYDVDKTDEVVDDDFSRIIQEFQKDHGINVTGVYNHETSEAIRSELSKIVFYPFLSRNSQNELRLGIMNRAGEQIIPANYTDYNVSNGIIKLWEVIRNRDGSGSIYGHSYYYITGEEIKIPEEYYVIGDRDFFNSGILRISEGGSKVSALDSRGELIWETPYSIHWPHDDDVDGYTKILDKRINGQNNYGILDSRGILVVPCQYDEDAIYPINSSWYELIKGEDEIELHHYYKNDISFPGARSYDEGEGIILIIVDKDGNNRRLINENGDVLNPESLNSRYIVNGFDSNGKGTYYNADGEKVIEVKCTESMEFMDEGLACIRTEGTGNTNHRRSRYELIDTTGNNPFPDIWSIHPIVFSDNLARIVHDGKVGYINKAGEFVIPMIWDYCDIEEEWDKDLFAKVDPTYYIYEQMQQFSGGLGLVANKDSLYYIDVSGEIIAYAGPAAYDSPMSRFIRSEESCQSIAKEYLKNRLKNPSSLQVHSVTSVMDGDSYIVTIDYSGMNSFGGFTRSTFICTVNSETGIVSNAIIY